MEKKEMYAKYYQKYLKLTEHNGEDEEHDLDNGEILAYLGEWSNDFNLDEEDVKNIIELFKNDFIFKQLMEIILKDTKEIEEEKDLNKKLLSIAEVKKIPKMEMMLFLNRIMQEDKKLLLRLMK
jgi:hypothetical protein